LPGDGLVRCEHPVSEQEGGGMEGCAVTQRWRCRLALCLVGFKEGQLFCRPKWLDTEFEDVWKEETNPFMLSIRVNKRTKHTRFRGGKNEKKKSVMIGKDVRAEQRKIEGKKIRKLNKIKYLNVKETVYD
jgi:hypothetical protein